MDATTRDFVRKRAANCCEYCHLPQETTPFITFHIEHIIAKQHVEESHDNPSGLAYACDRCNAFKGPNLSTIDPVTGSKVDVFNPRSMRGPSILPCPAVRLSASPRSVEQQFGCST
jgi:hypothetical protein